jgi:hypothetical protein
MKNLNMALEHKNGLGLFPNRQQTESALSQLKAIGFPIDSVSVVVDHPKSEDAGLEDLTEASVQSEEDFSTHRAIDRFEHGALVSGALGTVSGGIIAAGLIALSGGAGLLVGMAAGAFYGAVSGGLIGSAIGAGISDEQEKHYHDQLMKGYYLIVIQGTDDEISQAESVLKRKNIQDWIIFDTL